jgi:hypothetical protein
MKRNTTLLFSTLLALAALLVVGCKTVDVETLITPKRIEAVTALGAYYGGKAAIGKGHQAELERALAGLRSIQASGSADLPAVVKAIGDAGITFFESPEGQLSLGAVVTFADTWAGTAQPILDDERTRAFLAGTIRGFELALAQPKTRAIGDTAGDKLLADAVKTRPAKRAK